jgi:predicted RNA binding protein YcfA (HicA-like mRNA interferase family)
MFNLRQVSGEETVKALEQLGFVRARQRGSHVVLKKVMLTGTIGCVVPLHRELKIGTLLGILDQAKVDPQEFLKKL